MIRRSSLGATIQSVGLLIVLLGILSTVGILIYKSTHMATTGLNTSDQQSAVTAPEPTGKDGTVDSTNYASGPTYLTISEWGVKVPSTIPGVYYSVNASDSNIIALSNNAFKTNDCSADKTALGEYRRFMINDIDNRSAHTYISEYPKAVQLGAYYYVYAAPAADCTQSVAAGQRAGVVTKAKAAMVDFERQIGKVTN